MPACVEPPARVRLPRLQIPVMPALRNIDLHTLECLDTLLRERNVSRAAERMFMSQSAMSEMLGRLRERFGDPLLVRGRTGMQATPRAEALLPRVREALDRIVGLLNEGAAFNPAVSTQRFRISTSDYTQFLLLPRLVQALAAEAPRAAVDVLPVHVLRAEAALDAGDIDLAIAWLPEPPPGLRRSPLFRERTVMVARRGHPVGLGAFTPADFAALGHVSVAPSGLTYFSGAVDDALQALGLARRVAVSSPHFLMAALLVASSDLVLALPSRAAQGIAQWLPLEVHALPFETREIELAAYWHERTHDSAAHRWFRQQVKDALTAD